MANWLMDYIEMTEYIPPEFRDQTFAMRELDLKVSIAMSQLENDIKEFFSKIETLSQKEKQEQYEALVKRCDEASQVAQTKVKIADRLHDLVEKSMRLLDQGLEKLKEDLIEGDKAYIVEDIERRSQELDAQLRLEEETFMQRQQRIRDAKLNHSNAHHHHSKGLHSKSAANTTSNSHHVHSTNHVTNNHRVPIIHTSNQNHGAQHKEYPHSHQQHHLSQHHNHMDRDPSQITAANNPHYPRPYHHHGNNQHVNRQRNNSTGAQTITTTTTTTSATGVKQKKRERKRLNSAMTIFNRNSKTDDDSTTQTTFLSSPTTPDYLAGLHSSNSNSLNDISGGDTSLTLKGMIAQGNRGPVGAGSKSNGSDPLAKARQPILTAIDAAHAVSPNATNSDKLVLFSSNSNGDNYDSVRDRQHQQDLMVQVSQTGNLANSHHLTSSVGSNNSGQTITNSNGHKLQGGDGVYQHHNMNRAGLTPTSGSSPFSGLARHDPIMMAASQAINATQYMTPGRRTSSLKASYAAVNSGRLQHPSTNNSIFDQAALSGEVYCKCRGAIQDLNMIACDNVNCKIEWFHYACVGITAAPPGEWYCDDCRILPRSIQDQVANTSKHHQNRQAAEDMLQANNGLSGTKNEN